MFSREVPAKLVNKWHIGNTCQKAPKVVGKGEVCDGAGPSTRTHQQPRLRASINRQPILLHQAILDSLRAIVLNDENATTKLLTTTSPRPSLPPNPLNSPPPHFPNTLSGINRYFPPFSSANRFNCSLYPGSSVINATV